MPVDEVIRLDHSTAYGWLTWVDGSPPRVTVSDTQQSRADRIELDISADRTNAGGAFAANRRVRVTLLDAPSRWPAPEDLLASVARPGTEFVEVDFSLRCAPSDWFFIRSWITSIEKLLHRTFAMLRLSYVIRLTADTEFPRSVADLLTDRLPAVEIRIWDPGEMESESSLLVDRAADLANRGFRVRPAVSLSSSNQRRWGYWGSMWRIACHSDGVGFVRPRVAGAYSAPSSEAIAEFLCDAYDSKEFDIRSSYPFSILVTCLRDGVMSVPRCGSLTRMAIDCHGRRYACRHRSPPSYRFNGIRGCGYTSPLCSLFCEVCPGLRSIMCAEAISGWQMLFCPAISHLVTRMASDIARAARYERFLASVPPNTRFRAVARSGQVIVWMDTVVTDHRNRFEGGQRGDNEHDLSWVRARPAGAADGASNGAAGQAEPPAIGG